MIKTKISARGLHGKLERQLRQYVSRISNEMLDEISEEAKTFAEDLYAEAEYAGEDPLDRITVRVEESGPLSRELIVDDEDTGIATYIEYGTGIYATKRSANNLRLTPRRHTRSGRWFFYSDDRRPEGEIDVFLNDYVEQAQERMVRVKTEIYDEFGKATGEFEYQGETELDTREGVWTTKGNPANNVITKVREHILSETLPDVAKNTPGVRYTQW